MQLRPSGKDGCLLVFYLIYVSCVSQSCDKKSLGGPEDIFKIQTLPRHSYVWEQLAYTVSSIENTFREAYHTKTPEYLQYLQP